VRDQAQRHLKVSSARVHRALRQMVSVVFKDVLNFFKLFRAGGGRGGGGGLNNRLSEVGLDYQSPLQLPFSLPLHLFEHQ
jgi:hypothetical protein